MLGEYERNGLAGSEAEAMRKLRDTVSGLSEQEMREAIALLEKSRLAPDPHAAQEGLTGAWSAQKRVVDRLKQLLGEFDRSRLAQRTARKLTELSRRAAANLAGTVQLQKSAKPLLQPVVDATLEERQREQEAIASELKSAMPDIDTLASRNEPGDPWHTAQTRADEIAPTLNAAAEALKQSPLPTAIERQRAAREALHRLAETVAPEDAVKTLREAEQKLNKLVDDQKALVRDTEPVPREKDYDTWIVKSMKDPASPLAKMLAKAPVPPGTLVRNEPRVHAAFEAFQKKQGEDAATLAKRQGDLAETARELRGDLEVSGTNTSAALKEAAPPMESAQTNLHSNNPPNLPAALGDEANALARVQAAQAALQKDLATAEKSAAATAEARPGSKPGQPPPPASPLATLQDLQKQVRDILSKEDQATGDSRKQAAAEKKAGPATDPAETGRRTAQNIAAARNQEGLRQRTEQVRQRAATTAPQASQALEAAAGAMRGAETNLADPAKRAEAAAAAAKNLRNADGQLAQEIAKLEQTRESVGKADETDDSLTAIIEAEQKLELSTLAAIAAGSPQGAAGEIHSRQQAIQKDMGQIWRKHPLTGTAATALAEAGQEMNTVKTRAWKNDLESVDAAERRAIESLYKARDRQAKELAAASGQPPQPTGNEADSTQFDLQRAEKRTELASNTMMSAQPEPAGGQGAPDAQKPEGSSGEKGQQAQAGEKGQSGQKGQQTTPGQQGQPGGQKGQPCSQNAAAPAQPQTTGAPEMQKAAQQLTAAAADIGQAQADAAGLPEPLRDALQTAQAELTAAAAAASNGDAQTARESTEAAQGAIAQAQALLGQAQAGLAPAAPGTPEQPGAAPASANAAAPSPGSPENTQGKDGKAGQSVAETKAAPGGSGGKPTDGHPELALQRGSRSPVKTRQRFLGLPARDRAAIEQSQAEKYPEEYGAAVEQYMQNLSDNARP